MLTRRQPVKSQIVCHGASAARLIVQLAVTGAGLAGLIGHGSGSRSGAGRRVRGWSGSGSGPGPRLVPGLGLVPGLVTIPARLV
jgi:hypothetical protein